ncbi:MAG: sigma-70 family RNA polymerase sigma factor [Cyclobacteriaceae bacterium]
MSELQFEQYVLPVSDKMYRYAFSILKDSELASDVVQECLTKIWNKKSTLTNINNHEAWVMRIVRNQCYDWIKLNRYTMLTDEQQTLPDTQFTDDTTLLNDRLNWLQVALDRLPDKQKEVFHLREIEDMTYQDIAEVLSMSISDVKVNIHRARLKVREIILKIDAYGIAN